MKGTGKSQDGYVIPGDNKLCRAEYEGKEIISFVEQEAQRKVLLKRRGDEAFGISNRDEQKTHFKHYVRAIDIWGGDR